MRRVERPLNLITMDTERNQERRRQGLAPVQRIIRPRTVIYALILAVIGIGLLISLSTKSTLDVNVLHDRNPLFVSLADGGVRNGYTLKILNKGRIPARYHVAFAGVDGASLAVLGHEGETDVALDARPDTVTSYRLYVTAPRASLTDKAVESSLSLTDVETGQTTSYETIFRGP
jgi:polyferredoxin